MIWSALSSLLTAALSLAERVLPALLAWRQGRLSATLREREADLANTKKASEAGQVVDRMSDDAVVKRLSGWRRD